MTYRVKTKGNKEFVYTNEDIKRIESEDTECTKKFKIEYNKWRKNRKNTRKHIPIRKQINQKNGEKNKESVVIKEKQIKFTNKDKVVLINSLVIVIIVFLLLLSVLYMFHAKEEKEVFVETPYIGTEFTDKEIQESFSYQAYLDDPYFYNGKEIVLKGFLKKYIEGSDTSGVYVYAITDDYDQTIDIGKLPSTFIGLFSYKGITKEIYEIKGVFKRKYKTLNIDIISINKSERSPVKIIQVEKEVEKINRTTEMKTVYKFPQLRKIIIDFLTK